MEEMQVEVVKHIARAGVIALTTRVIPERYDTRGAGRGSEQLLRLLHRGTETQWPFYRSSGDDAASVGGRSADERVAVASVDFRCLIAPAVTHHIMLTGRRDGVADGVRLSGRIQPAPAVVLGATSAMNGDKILRLKRDVRVSAGTPICLSIYCGLGQGLGSFLLWIYQSSRDGWVARKRAAGNADGHLVGNGRLARTAASSALRRFAPRLSRWPATGSGAGFLWAAIALASPSSVRRSSCSGTR